MRKTYIKNVHGIKLTYTLDRTGWSYRVSGFKDRETMRKAILHLYPKHCPEYPPHLHESIVEANMQMLEVIRSLKPA